MNAYILPICTKPKAGRIVTFLEAALKLTAKVGDAEVSPQENQSGENVAKGRTKVVSRKDLTAYLDDYLAIEVVPDWKEAYNGLQVEGTSEVQRLALAVDACLYTIERAAAGQAQMLLVHHGLFWGTKAPVTGSYHRRLSALIKNDLNLYSSHTPLDAHIEVGNNAVLARLLELPISGRWGRVQGVPLGVYCDCTLSRTELSARLVGTLGAVPHLIATGPDQTRRIGIITGAASSSIDEAVAAGIDTFITGEAPHHAYFDAEESGINLVLSGHYATETVGIKALGIHLQERFGLESFFIDHPTGL